MNKIINYLQKNNIIFKSVQFGSSYFYNANPVKVNAIQVIFEFGKNEIQNENKILKYCNRYNYTVAFCGFNNHCSWFYIFTPSGYDSYMLYGKYEDKAKKDCEIYAHERYMTGQKPDNNALKKIMNKYGLLYLNEKSKNEGVKIA